MQSVFDYDPLLIEIQRLAAGQHYETQERLNLHGQSHTQSRLAS